MKKIVDIVGYEGRYAVTEDGFVWAHPNRSRKTGRWLKTVTGRCGYKYVVFIKDGIRKTIYVHRLVAKAFVTENGKPQVNHKNGIKTDNRSSNLEWMTASENKKHAYDTGITKITDKQRDASSRNITEYNKRKNK